MHQLIIINYGISYCMKTHVKELFGNLTDCSRNQQLCDFQLDCSGGRCTVWIDFEISIGLSSRLFQDLSIKPKITFCNYYKIDDF